MHMQNENHTWIWKIENFIKKFVTWPYASTATEYEIPITALNAVDAI